MYARAQASQSAPATQAPGTDQGPAQGGAGGGVGNQERQARQRPGSVPQDPTQPTSYTVVRGDTLWGIAAAWLGEGRRYTEIVALNTEKDLTPLPIGTRLRLPAVNDPTRGSIDLGDNWARHPAGAALSMELLGAAIEAILSGDPVGPALLRAARDELAGLADEDFAVVLNSLRSLGLLEPLLEALPADERNTVVDRAETMVPVNVTVFHGADAARVETDFKKANEVYNPHGISIEKGEVETVDEATSKAILGNELHLDEAGATDADADGQFTPNAEQSAVLARNRTPGRISAYWIDTFDNNAGLRGRAFAKVWWEIQDEGVVVKNAAAEDTFPHELGHILMQANHVDLDGLDEDGDGTPDEDGHDISNDNLMDDGGSRNVGVGDLTPEQVRAMKRSVYARFRG